MKATIELENMAFHAPHGCYDLEKQVGNRYLVTIAIDIDAGDAARNDDLGGTLNYLTAYELVRRQMAAPSDILENVALRILDALSAAFPQIMTARVKVSKLAPPLGGKVEKASVTLSR